MKRLPALTILLLTALIALVSCDKHEDIDRAYTDYRYDIVTYLRQNGTGAVFEYLGHGDSASVTLQSRVIVNEVKVHERVLLRYDFADKATTAATRNIDVYGCNGIFSDSLRMFMESPDSLPRHRVKLRSLWRTREFINLHCQVEFTGKSLLARLRCVIQCGRPVAQGLFQVPAHPPQRCDISRHRVLRF